MRALGWFREAGLEKPSAHTLAGGAHAPLSDDLRSALVALFQMHWPGVESELAAAPGIRSTLGKPADVRPAAL